MKYLITLLFLVLPIVCNAQGINPVGGCTRAHNSICQTQTTPNDMETSSGTYTPIGNDATTKYVSSAFTADAGTGKICKICIMYKKSGSPTMDFVVQVWSDNGGTPPLPSALLAKFGGMNAADIAGDFTDCFTGSVALTNGTIYHIVTIADTTDASNYFRYVEDDTCATESQAVDSDGGSFASIDTAKCAMVKLYK
jgi:hypothetical protein